MSTNDLQIHQLSKRYRTTANDVCALADVSLSASKGELIALHGVSGSGKSTLLYTIAGLITPDAGVITLDDDEMTAMSLSQRAQHRAQHIGLVFQDFRLVPYLNVLENVMLVHNDEEEAMTLLDQMKLIGRIHHKPAQLSAGEQQRCAVARALVKAPTLILADEPTGNLDVENSSIILNFLGDYASKGHIVIMATHDPAAVASAGRVISIAEGKVVTG